LPFEAKAHDGTAQQLNSHATEHPEQANDTTRMLYARHLRPLHTLSEHSMSKDQPSRCCL
jgi:hypothetical protein